jgi:hypothetical protein
LDPDIQHIHLVDIFVEPIKRKIKGDPGPEHEKNTESHGHAQQVDGCDQFVSPEVPEGY